jgi:hypothetical protein
MEKDTGSKVTIRSHLIEVSGSSKAKNLSLLVAKELSAAM